MRETLIDLPAGKLAVQAYGGAGPDVLFLHSLGFCGPQWRLVARRLTDRCRTFTMDLPGHAHSTVPLGEPADQWRHLPAVVDAMGLERPVLVGHDSAAWAATVAALHHPDLFSALVLVGGSMQRYLDACGLAQDPTFQAMLVDRFHLGVTASGEQSVQALKQQMVSSAPTDAMMAGLEAGIHEEVDHSVVQLADGSWMNTPTVDDVVNGLTFAVDDPDLPDDALYTRLTLPTWFVALSEGFDANLEPDLTEVQAGNPLIQLRVLTTGQWPQYTDIEGITQVVAEAAQA